MEGRTLGEAIKPGLKWYASRQIKSIFLDAIKYNRGKSKVEVRMEKG